MKVISILAGEVFPLPQCIYNGSSRAFSIRLCDSHAKPLNANLLQFSTFHCLLKGKEIAEDKTEDSPAEKKRGFKDSAGNASQSHSEKKKTSTKVKSLFIRPEINYNDFQIKMKQIQKFISKGLPVAVKVDNPKNKEEAFEGVFSKIEKSITENQISAKLTKTGPIINIYPVSTDTKADNKTKEEKGSSSSDTTKSSEDKS